VVEVVGPERLVDQLLGLRLHPGRESKNLGFCLQLNT
jgi:hypothetical protein